MTSILTPQEICELDTFTLEEKIEELQNLPNPVLYTDLLKIAKLELIDRLETEEFGRKLANDQYKIIEQFQFPNVKEAPQRQLLPSKLPPFSNHRKQGAMKMQSNLLSAGSFVTIGKPAVNHHYKPKIRKVQTIQATKNFLRSKKQNFSKGKIQKITYENDHLVKKQQIVAKKQEKDLILHQNQAQKLAIVEVKPSPPHPVQEFSLKEKLKRQVEKMQVIFRENDAYDDMRQIKLTPQNLLEQQSKMNQSEPINTQIDANQFQGSTKDASQLIDETLKQVKQDPIIEEIQGLPSREQEVNHDFIPFKVEFTEQNTKMQRIISTQIFPQSKYEGNFYPHQQHIQLPQIVPSINLDKLDPIPTIKPNKQVKSNSVRTLTKKIYHNLMSDSIKPLKGQENLKQTHQKTNSIKAMKEDLKSKPQNRMSRSNYGSFKPFPMKSQIYPYHQIIPSFHRLFPHSKNLLLTLRNVEENLKLHFSKQIDEKSKNNEYLRLNENDITFKVISECQKARKYADCFEIELASFHQRGEMMLNRIRGDYEVPNSDIMLYRVVRTKEEVYDIINSSFHRTKTWHQLPHGMELRVSWNLLWTWSKPQIDFSDLFYFQKVNHFIGNKQIARKDLLKKNIENVQKLGGKIKQFFDIIPETFLLPGENIAFIKKFREYGLKDPLNYWILKPVGLSRGRGIELVNKLQDVIFSQPVVLQRYISNPFLVDGYKFDMRIYVLVTSINPLEAFIYDQGFARLSTEQYSLDQTNMDNKYIHLTNFSINRENIADKKLSLEQQLGGCKISLKMLKKRMHLSGVSWERIEKQIDEIILKSLIACMNVIPQNPNCFQLFGYDIFLDSNLKCWLLQVNSSPSLQKQFMLDEIIKQQLVDDIMEIVSPISYNRQRLLEIVERRRKEAQGLKSSINVSTNSTWQLNQDLSYILSGQHLRKYGEMKHRNFKTLAPSEKYYSIVKVLQQYKIDPIIKEQR